MCCAAINLAVAGGTIADLTLFRFNAISASRIQEIARGLDTISERRLQEIFEELRQQSHSWQEVVRLVCTRESFSVSLLRALEEYPMLWCVALPNKQ
jgi:hypothetical protein